VITEGKQHEIQVARQLRYEPGTLLAIDRGYLDYGWFADLSEPGVYLVTRMKDKADYIGLEERELPHRKGLLRDQVICFYQPARDGQEGYFRRIEFYDEEQDRVLVFVTNHLTLAATTVAEVYKQRWQMERFFKALKQNLRLKTFIGTAANPEDPSLGGVDCHVANQVPAVEGHLRLVAFQSGGAAAAAGVRLP